MIWHRPNERKELWHYFKIKKNVSMFAPRRIGKSHLMKIFMLEDAEKNRWDATYTDLQGCDTAEDAVLTIIKDIQEGSHWGSVLFNNVAAKLKSVLGGKTPTSFKELVQEANWKDLLDVVLKDLSEYSDNGTEVLIMVDEVTVCATHIFARSESDGKQFLNYLAMMRDKYPNIRWLMTGSIGIDHLAQAYNVQGAFRNLTPFLLEPFSSDVAKAFVDDYCQHSVQTAFTLSNDVHAHFQKRLGWLSPHYLAEFCLRIEPELVNEKYLCTVKSIDAACDKIIHYPFHHIFAGWPDHLERNIVPQYRAVCRSILGLLAEDRPGLTLDGLQIALGETIDRKNIKKALTILKTDGFIKEDNSKQYLFVMSLLADYWQEFQ
jgi:hypothetical protein